MSVKLKRCKIEEAVFNYLSCMEVSGEQNSTIEFSLGRSACLEGHFSQFFISVREFYHKSWLSATKNAFSILPLLKERKTWGVKLFDDSSFDFGHGLVVLVSNFRRWITRCSQNIWSLSSMNQLLGFMELFVTYKDLFQPSWLNLMKHRTKERFENLLVEK